MYNFVELLSIAKLAVMVITDKKSGYFRVVLRLTKLYLLPEKNTCQITLTQSISLTLNNLVAPACV